MQTVTPEFLTTLTGSHHPIWRADAWYDGRVTVKGLNITAASVTVSRGSQVRADLSIDITDTDGSLAPRSSGAPLAARGQEIHVMAGLQVGVLEELVSLGWFRIRTAEFVTHYGVYDRPDIPTGKFWVNRPSQISVTGADRMRIIERARFISREQPAGGGVFGELARICRNRRVGWATPAGVSDATVPAGTTYDDDALGAAVKLAAAVDTVPVMNPAGSLTLLPNTTSGGVVWTVPALPGGLRVTLNGLMTDEDISNVAVERGKAADNTILQSVAQTVGGYFDSNGPFGSVPYFHSSDFLDTQGKVDAGANTLLGTITRDRSLAVEVTCISNPALLCGDLVALPAPRGTVTGTVEKATWKAGALTMTMTVLVDAEAFLAVI